MNSTKSLVHDEVATATVSPDSGSVDTVLPESNHSSETDCPESDPDVGGTEDQAEASCDTTGSHDVSLEGGDGKATCTVSQGSTGNDSDYNDARTNSVSFPFGIDGDDATTDSDEDSRRLRLIDLANVVVDYAGIQEQVLPPQSQTIPESQISMADMVDSMRMSKGDTSSITDHVLQHRIQDFQHAQKQRRRRYSFRPFGIIGLFCNLSDIRTDLRWAQDAATRRALGKPYLGWREYEKGRSQGMNRPFFTYLVVLACCVMTAMGLYWNHWEIEPLHVNPLFGPSPEVLLMLGALQTREMIENGSWYRLVSAVFLHGGIIHLVVNISVIAVMGRVIERNHGSIHTAVLFFVPAIGGNIISSLMQPSYILVGASGGIFGLIGVCVADIALNWKLLFLAFKDHNGRPASLWTRLCCMFWLLFDLFINSIIGFTPFVDNYAHLGGLVYGFLISLTVLQRLPLSFFGSRKGIFHNCLGQLLRFSGVIIAIILICATTILLSESDGYKSPCPQCRYISCTPFPIWTDEKWWYCDGCDAVSGEAYRHNGDAWFTDLDLYCPSTGDLVQLSIVEDRFKDTTQLQRALPSYCREYC